MSEDRKMYPIKCSDCGTDSEVPFEPNQTDLYTAENVYQNIDLADKDFRLNLFSLLI